MTQGWTDRRSAVLIQAMQPPSRRVARATAAAPNLFPVPHLLAEALSIRVVEARVLPGDAEQLTDGRTIWCAWHHDQRVRGTRIFRAIAVAAMGQQGETHSEAESWELTAKLAVPIPLMQRVGLEETIRTQTWATEFIIRWWWNETGCT